MWDVKACVACFSTECILYKVDDGPLKQDFFWISGLKSADMDGIPKYLCVECTAYVSRFRKFRDKCKRAHYAMKQLIQTNKQITINTFQAINRKYLNIAPTRSFVDLNNCHYETSQFVWNKGTYNRGGISSIPTDDTIPVFHFSNVSLENEFETPSKRPKITQSIKEEVVELTKVFEVGINNHDQAFLAPMSSVPSDDYLNNYHFGDDDQETDHYTSKGVPEKNVDGSNLEEEYASMVPITMKDAQAAAEVYKMFRKGNLICPTCSKKFSNKSLYDVHIRMHDQHKSGNFQCVLCQTFYKTDFLLKTHMTDKHMYKYICRKCPEVNFDRISAKQHFIWTHLQKGYKKAANWYECRPTWLRKSGVNRGNDAVRGVVKLRPVRKIKKLPDDFLIYTPVTHEEQYRIVEERKLTRNYLEATYKCELCYRGFREAVTYGKHMRKHDPATSGEMQCDMCKLHFRDARKVYKHMIITHLFKYSCQVCNFICYNKGQAHMHYRWHKNVTYTCQYCNKEFKKASTRLTHIRIKHPSTIICDICGHSFVSETGLYCHKKLAHSTEEIETSSSTLADPSHPHYCADCGLQFLSATAYKTHLGSSSKHATTNVSIKPVRLSRPGAGGARRAGRARNGSSEIVNTGVPTATHCEICNKFLSNDVQARKHYETEHPGAEFLKRYMCDVCGHTTRQYANLMVHMRTHTQEKPYGCPHCDRRFSMPSNRDRHLVVHTGEKKYQCQHCSRRFTQSSAVKLHIQTVHLKIPYAPWDKKNRKRRKEMEGGPPASAAPGPQPKLLLDTQGNYLSAYITYNDE